MASEAGNPRVRVKVEDSPLEGPITYKRRKLAKPSSGVRECVDVEMIKSDFEQGGHDVDSRLRNWRYMLEQQLCSPDINEGGGIQRCMQAALSLGPSRFYKKHEMADVPGDMEGCEGQCDVKPQSGRLDSSTSTASTVSRTGSQEHVENTRKCENVFLDILVSEKFALLCDLLCRTSEENKFGQYVNFSLINTRVKNGDYGRSPGLFVNDIQQIWAKLENFGREIVLLSSSLSNLSRASYQKEVGEALEPGASDHKPEETSLVGVERKNCRESYTTIQLASCDSDRSTNPDLTEASGLYKISACKDCGAEADGKQSLICDGATRTEFPEAALYPIDLDNLHDNCAVCARLEVSKEPETKESSVSSMEAGDPPPMTRAAKPRLCKLCGSGEAEDKRFLVCGHALCPFMFYHIRCLRASQIASAQKQNQSCWYCPSCLCRACLTDQDDDNIVLCDGCDEAYHIYCMKPPCASVPEGRWYCVTCNLERAREGLKKYEQWILEQHRNDKQGNEVTGSTDLPPDAVVKASSELVE